MIRITQLNNKSIESLLIGKCLLAMVAKTGLGLGPEKFLVNPYVMAAKHCLPSCSFDSKEQQLLVLNLCHFHIVAAASTDTSRHSQTQRSSS